MVKCILRQYTVQQYINRGVTMESIRDVVGNNLKKQRKDRQLTLEGLSNMTGVSKSMLGEIERAATNPTITVLWKIAGGLKIPFTTLVHEEKPDIVIVKEEDHQEFIQKDEFTISSIFDFNSKKKFEIYHINFLPGSKHESKGHTKGVEEYVFVYEGIMRVDVDNEKFILQTGDSINFKAEKYHAYINEEDQEVKAYSLIYYGDDSKE